MLTSSIVGEEISVGNLGAGV